MDKEVWCLMCLELSWDCRERASLSKELILRTSCWEAVWCLGVAGWAGVSERERKSKETGSLAKKRRLKEENGSEIIWLHSLVKPHWSWFNPPNHQGLTQSWACTLVCMLYMSSLETSSPKTSLWEFYFKLSCFALENSGDDLIQLTLSIPWSSISEILMNSK